MCSQNLQTIQVLLADGQHSVSALSSTHLLHLAVTQHQRAIRDQLDSKVSHSVEPLLSITVGYY